MNPESWNDEAKKVFEDAEALARRRGNQQPSEVHLLAALISHENGEIARALEKAGADPKAVTSEIDRVLNGRPKNCDGPLFRSPEMAVAMVKAEESRRKSPCEKVAVCHVLLGLLETGSSAATLLARLGLTADKVVMGLTAVGAVTWL